MIERDDLRAGISAGIITEAQAASLKALSDSRRGDRENLADGDEPFELFRGFNEIFIVVGLGILTLGWVTINAIIVNDGGIGNYRGRVLVATVIGAVALWLLSEYFVRRRRMVAPAIVLSALFAANAATGFVGYMAQPFMVAQEEFSSLPLPIALAILATAVFWLRFKVPFAMAIIAVAAFGLSMVIAATSSGTPSSFSDLFLLSADGPFALITLVLGFGVFAIAMWFDMSDPHRVTRRSAQGFWLHLVAAPALINTIALTFLARETGAANLALGAILLVFALVAIVIDRRSFLIAATGYIVALTNTIFDGDATAFTILLLGLVLVFLGAFWERIRARLLAPLSQVVPVNKLPPSVTQG